MKLNELKYTEGARRDRYRVGRGVGSGNGKTSGQGQKGQTPRSGHVAIGFEGGQTPLWRRLPKRGFTNYTRKEFAVVNVEQLNCFEEGTVVTPELLMATGIVKKELDGIKVLGAGELTVKLTVKANKFSQSARAAIEEVGGTAEEI